MSATPIDLTFAKAPQDEHPGSPEAITLRLDTRGLSCPMPIVKTAQAITSLASGQLLEVIAHHPKSVTDFRAWAKSTGNTLVDSSADDGVYRFVFRRK